MFKMLCPPCRPTAWCSIIIRSAALTIGTYMSTRHSNSYVCTCDPLKTHVIRIPPMRLHIRHCQWPTTDLWPCPPFVSTPAYRRRDGCYFGSRKQPFFRDKRNGASDFERRCLGARSRRLVDWLFTSLGLS